MRMECPICVERAAKFAAWQGKMIPIGKVEHRAYLDMARSNPKACSLRIERKHADWRAGTRKITDLEIRQVLGRGKVIERYPRERSTLVVLGFVQRENETIAIHVVVSFDPDAPYHWLVETVYYPEDKYWYWTDNYSRRVCWCEQPPQKEGI